MGNGVSVQPDRPAANLLESDISVQAAQKLSKNKDHQKQFAAFLQDGTWLDKVGLLSSIQSSRYDVPSPEANFLCGYLLPASLTEKDIAKMRMINANQKDAISSEGSEKTVSLHGDSPPPRRHQSSEKTFNLFKDSVRTKPVGLDKSEQSTTVGAHCTNEIDRNARGSSPPFSKKQILKILVSVAYPLFEQHRI